MWINEFSSRGITEIIDHYLKFFLVIGFASRRTSQFGFVIDFAQ